MVSGAMKTSMDNDGIKPFTSFVEVGKAVIVRDRPIHKDDTGFRRAIACVSNARVRIR